MAVEQGGPAEELEEGEGRGDLVDQDNVTLPERHEVQGEVEHPETGAAGS